MGKKKGNKKKHAHKSRAKSPPVPYSPPFTSRSCSPDERSTETDFKRTADDAINKLSSLGYHRARAMGVSNYDKITGGVSWLLRFFLTRVKSEDWCFKEDEPEQPKKCLALKRIEIDQIIYAKTVMGYHEGLTPYDFINVNGPVLYKFVNWLGQKYTHDLMEKHRYECFMGTFANMYEDTEAHATDFLHSLRRPNELQHTDCLWMDTYNISILRDERAKGSMALADLINYARTMNTVYTAYVPHEQVVWGMEFVSEETYAKDRKNLDEIFDKLYSSLELASSKENVDKLCWYLDEIDIGSTLAQMEERFVEEGACYYATYVEFTEFNELYKQSSDIVANMKTVNAVKLSEIVEDGITRLRKAREVFTTDVRICNVIENNLRDNCDEKGRHMEYCPSKREKADKQAEQRLSFDKNVIRCSDFIVKLRMNMEDFEKICRQRDESVPDEDDDDESRNSRYSYVDPIDDECTILTSKINKALGKLQDLPEAEEKGDIEFRKAFLWFLTDAGHFVTDWYWKAKFLKEERLDVLRSMRKLKEGARKGSHRCYWAKLEVEKLEVINSCLRDAKIDVAKWEAESEAFRSLHRGKPAPPVPTPSPCPHYRSPQFSGYIERTS